MACRLEITLSRQLRHFQLSDNSMHLALFFSENTSLGQADDVCLASLDVGAVHALVVAERLVEGLHERVDSASEATAPDRRFGCHDARESRRVCLDPDGLVQEQNQDASGIR